MGRAVPASTHEDYSHLDLSEHDPLQKVAESQEPLEPEGRQSSQSLFTWALTLFGTAVGAGILFLPINAGSFGFWPLLIATVFIGPLVFFSHRTYSRIVSASPTRGLDVLEIVYELTGRKRGLATAVMYWLSIYPTVLIYGVSITNTVDSFIVNQLHGPQLNRWVLAPLCVGALTAVFVLGRRVVLRIASILVYPLIIALGGISLYLIPKWDLESFFHYQSHTPIWLSLLLILPVLVFSFSHMAAVSQLVLDMEKSHGAENEKQVSKVELVTTIMLVVFTMFFVWSCSMALGADGMDKAAEANVPVLTYFANVTHTPMMAFAAPVIALIAIATSYYGHMMGTEEGTKYLVRFFAPEWAERVEGRKFSILIYVAVFVTTSLVAILNPSIMDLISVVGGLFVAFLVYILPMLLFQRAKSLRSYARRPETVIIFLVGLLIMGVTVYNLVH